MNSIPQKSQEENRDLWYQRMSDKTPISPENEPVVGLMEWVDLMVEFESDLNS